MEEAGVEVVVMEAGTATAGTAGVMEAATVVGMAVDTVTEGTVWADMATASEGTATGAMD
jgi:hypothetical protein